MNRCALIRFPARAKVPPMSERSTVGKSQRARRPNSNLEVTYERESYSVDLEIAGILRAIGRAGRRIVQRHAQGLRRQIHFGLRNTMGNREPARWRLLV